MTTNPTTDTGAGAKPTAAIEKKAPTRAEFLAKKFDQWKPTLKAILPRHLDVDRVIKTAMNAYLRNPKLVVCDPTSMVLATAECAELGLDPSPLLGEAYFVPFNNTKKIKDGNVYREIKVLEVQLMPGYLGIAKLAKQTGDIADIYAVVVDECEASEEYFLVTRGTSPNVHHKIRSTGRTGKLFAVYGVVLFKDKTTHFEVLFREDVDKIRKRSKTPDEGPWNTDYNAMAKKSAIKQALKTIPKSPERIQLAQAIATDDGVDPSVVFANAIDTEGVDTTEEATPADVASTPQPKSRTQDLSDKLDSKPDPDGIIR